MSLLRSRSLAVAAALVWTALSPPAAYAQATYSFDLPAQDLGRSLRAIARRTGSNIAFDPASVRGRTAPPLRGSYSAEQALARLLAETGLSARQTGGGSWIISPAEGGGPPADRAGSAAPDEEDGAIFVTGSRIRGAESPSRTVEVTNEEAKDAGFTDLGQVIRSIPENYSGGQNPGVAPGAGGITNQDITQASALNLRGLGPDATLTLLNGRRLSYNGFVQAVDVSVVPIGALSRIEIVPDGASALYGSDAVAGVANIILRRDFDGVDTTARYGGPTGGGGKERQLSVTAGTTWSSGGGIAAYEYSDADPIFSDQRAYTRYMPDPATIYPSRRQHSALLSAYQRLGRSVELGLDGLHTRRSSLALVSTQPFDRVFVNTKSEIYALSPRLKIALPGDWSATVGGTHSRDETVSDTQIFELDGTPVFGFETCYCNTSYSAEADADGPLLRLPGGDVRVAIGIGYRRSDFELVSLTSGRRQGGRRSSRYAFGEIQLPIAGSAQRIPGVERLIATAALRHEDYAEIGSITTPKLGLIYEPTPDFGLRGSWGRSFKAPTLLQEFSNYVVYLFAAEDVGGTGLPPGSTVLMPYGGNRNLRPERAETWSVTFSAHPRALPGFDFEIGYFEVDYRDRVLQPIAAIERTLNDPSHSEFVQLDPSPAVQAEAIALSATGITNFAGVPYDPANVVAIASNLYANVARSTVRGVDVSASYGFRMGRGRMRVSGSATWLEGSQRNSPGQAEFQTVGLIFNPSKFSARGGIVWNRGGLTLAAFVNHVGGVVDNRQAPARGGDAFTTVDTNIRYRTDAGRSPLSDLEFALTARNLLDRGPPLVPPIVDWVVNYDSTNYSAIGRFVSLSVTKHW